MMDARRTIAVILLLALVIPFVGAFVSQAEDDLESNEVITFNDTLVLQDVIDRIQDRLVSLEEEGLDSIVITLVQEKLSMAEQALAQRDIEEANQLVIEAVNEISQEHAMIRLLERIGLLEERINQSTTLSLEEKERIMTMLNEATMLMNQGNITEAVKVMNQVKLELKNQLMLELKLMHQFKLGEKQMNQFMKHESSCNCNDDTGKHEHGAWDHVRARDMLRKQDHTCQSPLDLTDETG